MDDKMKEKLMQIKSLVDECLEEDYSEDEEMEDDDSEEPAPKKKKGMEGLLLMVEGRKGKK